MLKATKGWILCCCWGWAGLACCCCPNTEGCCAEKGFRITSLPCSSADPAVEKMPLAPAAADCCCAPPLGVTEPPNCASKAPKLLGLSRLKEGLKAG